jgi:hypothetical protein
MDYLVIYVLLVTLSHQVDDVVPSHLISSLRLPADKPIGADCEVAGIAMSTMEAAKGYWRPTNSTFSFVKCLRPAHCNGGSAADLVLYTPSLFLLILSHID